jgi:raffinose/stachyose/melibiose transport system substrate-binding protein
MTKKIVLIVFAVCILFSAIACSKGKKEPVTLTFLNWLHAEEMPFYDKLVEKVNALYPHISLENDNILWGDLHSVMQTRIAANNVPDIINVKGQDVATFAGRDLLLDLTDNDFLDNVIQSARKNLRVNNRDYGLPYTALYQGVFYNKQMFSKYGLTVPKTYDDLTAICKKLKENGITPWATHFKNDWHIGNMTMQYAIPEVFTKYPAWGDDLFAGKVSFSTSPEYRRVFQRVKDMYDNTWEDTWSLEVADAGRKMAKEEAAMICTGTWSVQYLEQNPDLDYGIFPFPGTDPGAKLIYEPNHTFLISKNSEHKEDALAVLKLLAEDKELNSFLLGLYSEYSMLKDVLPPKVTKASTAIKEWADKGEIVDVSIGNNQIIWPYQAEYSRYILDWVSGQSTLDEALERADAYKDSIQR